MPGLPTWPRLDQLRRAGFSGLRVVGDVHGDANSFEHAVAAAAAENLFLIQLGDLTDEGPDSAAVLRVMLGLLHEGRGCFVLGNHDHKLRRALSGMAVSGGPGLARTLRQINAAPDAAALRAGAIAAIGAAPAWLRLGPLFFVHGGFHPAMLHEESPPDAGLVRPLHEVARALYGQIGGARGASGRPLRQHRWVDTIPPGITVYCGHDIRSIDGRPLAQQGRAGGLAIFLDTGAGKGGHLSWLDLPLPA